MNKWIVIAAVLFLSACSANALHQKLVPTPEPVSNNIRIQLDCTDNGFYIFEGFPDIVRAETKTVSASTAATVESTANKSIADSHSVCLAQLEKPNGL